MRIKLNEHLRIKLNGYLRIKLNEYLCIELNEYLRIKVAPYTLVEYLYRSVSNFRRPANVLKYNDHEKLFFEAFLRRNCQVFCS